MAIESGAGRRKARPPTRRGEGRGRILAAANDLFYARGLRAVGVDEIIAAAGVTKVTFYRHFPSKDDLVPAWLDYRHALWMNWFVEALARHGAALAGRRKAAAPFEPLAAALQEWFAEPGFRGCAFVNVLAEIGPAPAAIVARTVAHKREMTAAIARLIEDRPDKAALADAAALLADGAMVRARQGEGALALAALRLALERLAPGDQ